METLRVAAIQMGHGETLDANLAKARAMAADAAAAGARLVLLPEYFFATFSTPRSDPAGDAVRIRDALRAMSADLGVAVAGNVVDQTSRHNIGVVYGDGRLVLDQPKIHPMPREVQNGLVGGADLRVAEVAGHTIGMLVCADILYPEAARILALQRADVLLNPVMSPWREEDDGREARVAMYVARAYDSGAFVIKAAGFRRPTPGATPPLAIAGRSLITAPWGVLARATDDFSEELLVADLDLDRLRAFRERQGAFPARRPEAYADLVKPDGPGRD